MGWSPLFHTRFPVSRTTPDTTMSLYLSLTRLSLSLVCFPKQFCQILRINYVVHNPSRITSQGLGSSSFARHYSRNRVFFLFLQVLRCFSSLRSLLTHYFTHVQISQLLPNQSSLIRISVNIMDICSSSQLFAAYHVLHRLLVPRHSPYALSSLTFFKVNQFFNPKTFYQFFQFTLFFIYIFFNVLILLLLFIVITFYKKKEILM